MPHSFRPFYHPASALTPESRPIPRPPWTKRALATVKPWRPLATKALSLLLALPAAWAPLATLPPVALAPLAALASFATLSPRSATAAPTEPPHLQTATIGRVVIGDDEDDPVTVYFPQTAATTSGSSQDNSPGQTRSNSQLVIISHGSGGNPLVHQDLMKALVSAGYVVAFPQHHDDNTQHDGNPGPDSWKLRPREVSHAIDVVAADPRFANWVDTRQVGMYGMSAGGHTALSLAGGSWSPGNFKRHCEADLDADFQSCVGLITRLTGGMFDGLKRWGALAVIRHRFDDDTPQVHQDPRIAAIVAAVPAAADFDFDSLKRPTVPLALVTAGRDAWLVPRFHSDRVLAVCQTCVHLADLPTGGHGAYLSPLPRGLSGLLGDLLNDPPGFDRAVLPEIDRKIVEWFQRTLPAPTRCTTLPTSQ